MSPRFLFGRLRGHGTTTGDGGQGGQDGREQLPCWATSKFKEMTPLNVSKVKGCICRAGSSRDTFEGNVYFEAGGGGIELNSYSKGAAGIVLEISK